MGKTIVDLKLACMLPNTGTQEEKVGGEPPKSAGQTATDAAVGGIYAGLKLTGLALRVAKVRLLVDAETRCWLPIT